MPSDTQLDAPHQADVEQLFALAERLDLTDIALAGLIGISPHTMRVIRITRAAPQSERCRGLIRRFVQRNRAAKRRTDIRLAG